MGSRLRRSLGRALASLELICAACFAMVSASSLPGIPLWPGTHASRGINGSCVVSGYSIAGQPYPSPSSAACWLYW
jgi:hypothetical protein